MRIWIITPFEPIPSDGDVRMMRAGSLSDQLARRDVEVVWWTPDFEHYSKLHRHGDDRTVQVTPTYEIRLLKSLGYRSHVGPRRLLHNRLLARRWAKAARTDASNPDLILCAWPTPDLADQAVRFGRERDIPVLLDIRDLWPDLWVGILPGILRPLGRLLLHPYYRMARKAFTGASAIVGITDEYVRWALRFTSRTRTDEDRTFGFGFNRQELSAGERSVAETLLAEKGFTPDDRLLCVFAGTFGRSFEFESVVEAGRLLDRTARGRARLLLCGSGDRWEAIRKLAADVESIQILPRVSLPELHLLYEQASIGLAPYRDIENFQKNLPNKINEFLAMGLAILSPVSGCIRALIEEQQVGVTYRPDSPESLAEVIRGLLEDPRRLADLRGNAGRLGRETADSDRISSEYADHLMAIAGHAVNETGT